MDKKVIESDYNKLLTNIVNHIEQSKLKVFSEINKELLLAYWNIGRELSENASYGKSIVEKLSRDLRIKFPNVKGNLWNMKKFYETYQILQPLAADLLFNIAWTNHIIILDKTNSDEEKQFYLKMCIKERWTKRELERQIDASLFERYVIADKPDKVIALIPKHEQKELANHFKDEYVLEFLNLQKEYSEKEFENTILDNLRDFFLEFGKSFAFIGSQYIIDIGGRENKIDLLFYHRELRCLVAVDLKIGEFKAEFIGQMQKYLAALDEKIRLSNEKESVGLILCKSKNYEEVKFALAKTLSPVKVATYKTRLPDKKLIIKRLEQFKFEDVKK